MEKSHVNIIVCLILVIGVLVMLVGASYIPVHFTCQKDGKRSDVYGFQTRFDYLYNDHVVRKYTLEFNEGSSAPEIQGAAKQELKAECTRW